MDNDSSLDMSVARAWSEVRSLMAGARGQWLPEDIYLAVGNDTRIDGVCEVFYFAHLTTASVMK